MLQRGRLSACQGPHPPAICGVLLKLVISRYNSYHSLCALPQHTASVLSCIDGLQLLSWDLMPLQVPLQGLFHNINFLKFVLRCHDLAYRA